jgi:hypothetical protein
MLDGRVKEGVLENVRDFLDPASQEQHRGQGDEGIFIPKKIGV